MFAYGCLDFQQLSFYYGNNEMHNNELFSAFGKPICFMYDVLLNRYFLWNYPSKCPAFLPITLYIKFASLFSFYIRLVKVTRRGVYHDGKFQL